MYLLDTNICIFAIKRKPAKVLELIKKRPEESIYISSLTVAELEFGVQNSEKMEQNRIALLKFLSIFKILNFDDADAIDYGRLKVDLRKKRELIGPIDMLLAAQALNKEIIFVTNNVKEFKKVDGLRIEDWSV
ncbi:MAG: type II toxin-antitoxin system VapC family toxin [Spirochaetia bacterium]|nr:type II toxin-antitoxin system VapC family toxin [Spirochaetia bacterium]MCF7953057.1 type II toxin-antitoxin system VapC family toxin [Spirochaetales bacterium]MCF8012638.1 type II toxin-antitoxin system VapC family toxin [Clostridiales bacterium]